jgi:hypothetical protein
MYQSFTKYTDISLTALEFINDKQTVFDKKQNILDSVLAEHKINLKNVLFFGFNPWLLTIQCNDIVVTCASDNVKEYLKANNKKVTYVDVEELLDGDQSFDCVIAIDEFTTFAKTETDQREKIDFISDLTDKLLITSIRDYKNQDYKEKDFSLPTAIKQDQLSKIFIEYNDYDYQDRYAWLSQVYELTGSEMQYHGSYNRRAVFFKQLAKFTLDAGAKKFLVHKNSMYKSLIRRNYEYLIGIEF